MVLTWGKYEHDWAKSKNGVPTGVWTALDLPKDGTTKVEEQEGEEIVAKEEGGGIVDVRRGEGTVTVTFSQFVKAGQRPLFEGKLGQIPGEFAYRLRGLEDELWGVLIERASIYAKLVLSTAEGMQIEYTLKGLKPAKGDTLKLKKSSELKEPTASASA